MDTRPLRMLTGSEIVTRGKNVADCILPEVGLKEVTPNGSWLEKKQVQTALETRKALVAAERINKLETLSHAEWIDTLRLAKVTQLSGGHWQYLGHNVNGIIHLLPEEILYLMEVNCLQLKHNDVPVSLQKAYNLLLNDEMSLVRYKVYASLSRVGYKVFRHDGPMPSTPVPKKPPIKETKSVMVVTPMELNDDGISNILFKDVQPTDNNSLSSTLLLSKPSHNGTSNDKCIISDGPVSVEDGTSTECSMTNDDSIMETEESLDLSQPLDNVEFTKKSILSIDQVTLNDGDSNKEAGKSLGLSKPLGNKESTEKFTLSVNLKTPNEDNSNLEQPPKNIKSTAESTISVDLVSSHDGDSKKDTEMLSDPLQPPSNVEYTEKSMLSVDPVTSNDDDSNKETEKSLGISEPPYNEESTDRSTASVNPVALYAGDSNRDAEKSLDLLQPPKNLDSTEKTTQSVVPNYDNFNKETEKSLGLSQPPKPSECSKESIVSVDPVASNFDDPNRVAGKSLDLFQSPNNVDSTEKTSPSVVPKLPYDDSNKETEKSLGLSQPPKNTELTKESIFSVDTVASNDDDSNIDAAMSSDLLQPPNDVEYTEKSLSVDTETSNKDTVKSLGLSQPSNNTKSQSQDQVALNDVDSNMDTDKTLDTSHPNYTELTKESTITVDPVAPNSFQLSETSQMSVEVPKDPNLNDRNSTESIVGDLLSNDTNQDSKDSSEPVQLLNNNNPNEEYAVSLEQQLTNSTTVDMDCSMLIDQPTESKTNDCTNYYNSGIVHPDSSATFSIDGQGVVRVIDKVVSSDVEMEPVTSVTSGRAEKTETDVRISPPNKPEHTQNSYKVKQWKIENRKIQSTNPNILQEMFKTFPDFYNKQIVTINVPKEQYLPRNIYLNNTSYVIDINKLKSQRKPTTNKPYYRAIRNSSVPKRTTPMPQKPIPNLQPFFGMPVWRPRQQMFNRPVFTMQPFNHAIYRPTFPSHTLSYRTNEQTNRPRAHFQLPKRQRDSKSDHLNAIKHCAQRLKQFGTPPENCRESLMGLVNRYNEIYNEQVQIAPDYTIIENFQVIELDDDEVPAKKPKPSNEKYDLYLTEVKTLANRLNIMQRKKQPASKHKRAFSNLLKHFNETFDSDFYLNPKGELTDRKLVILDSSSDSDVVATEDLKPRMRKKRRADSHDYGSSKKKKILRNPFSTAMNKASVNQPINLAPVANATDLLKYFHKNWLPNEDDFGKAVLSSKTNALHFREDSQKLYEFMDEPDSFKSWVELKLCFYSKMASILSFEQDLSMHSRHLTMNNSRLKPILDNSFEDWNTSLELLRIIKTNTDVEETSLRIDFNVYNRDVQNFRKTDPPKPHFRIVCVDECSPFPSGAEVRALHSRHDDVTIVFAIVGVGSITYLQIKPTELPVYVGNASTLF